MHKNDWRFLNKMTDHLSAAKQILSNLKSTLETQQSWWEQARVDNPNFSPLSHKSQKEKHAQCWLHGTTNFLESNEIDRWLFDNPPLTQTAKSNAKDAYDVWRTWLEHPKPNGAYYSEFEDFEIMSPNKNEKLYDFILRLAHITEIDGKGHRLEWRALKSFLSFLRDLYITDKAETAFIEQIFPRDMRLQDLSDSFKSIYRKIAPEVYPIPLEIAADIIIELVTMIRSRRPNGQLTALESLGYCWLCLTASRLRLPTTVEAIDKLLGSHYAPLANLDQILGRFNSHLKNAILVLADEAIWGGNKREIGALKALITEPKMFIEGKGKDGRAF